MDTARAYITAVMARLAHPLLAGVTYEYGVSSLGFDENTAPPRLDWRYGRIRHQEPTTGNIYTEFQELVVQVWGSAGASQDESETNTRVLKNWLLAAAREVALTNFAEAIEVADFDWSEEAHMDHGRWLEGSFFVPLPVSGRNQVLATIATVGVKGIAVLTVDESICDDNFSELNMAFPTQHFNIGRIGSPSVADSPGTPDPAALSVFGQMNIYRDVTISAVHLHGIEDKGSGSITIEVYRRRSGVAVLLGTLTLVGGSGDFATDALVPASPGLLAGDYLFAQVISFVGSGGYDGLTVDVHTF